MSELKFDTEIVQPTLDSLNRDQLLDLMSESYADDFIEWHAQLIIERATHFFLMKSSMGKLAAAVVAREGRITSLSTSRDPDLGSRFTLGSLILEECHLSGHVSWTSAGLNYNRVIDLLQSAGMERMNDPDLVAKLFGCDSTEDFASIGKLIIPMYIDGKRQLKDGTIVINGPTSTRPGYPQSVWAWSDRLQQ